MRTLLLILLIFSFGCGLIHVQSHESTSPGKRVKTAGFVQTKALPTLVGKIAPGFTATAVMGDNRFKKLHLSSYRGRYVILFMYPMDFTFVCPTEIIAFDKKLEEFRGAGCEVIGVSTDSQFTHLAWKDKPVEEGGIGPIRYPLVSDITKSISRSYGVLHDESVALRGLFLIDPSGKVRHALVNDLALGRNIDEALRTLQALKIVDKYGDLCPANWEPGKETIKLPK